MIWVIWIKGGIDKISRVEAGVTNTPSSAGPVNTRSSPNTVPVKVSVPPVAVTNASSPGFSSQVTVNVPSDAVVVGEH